MSTTEFKPSDLIAYLGRGAPHGHYWHRWSETRNETQWYSTSAVPRPDDFTDKHDLYFGVHPCGEIPPGVRQHVRSRNLYIGAVNCVYCDVDFDKWPGGEEVARKFVEGLKTADTGPSPHVIVFTGGGFHLYWLLDTPTVFESMGTPSKVRDYVDLLQKKWIRFIGADPGAQDLARLLRVPNSMNCKTRYETPRRVEIVYVEMGAGFYTLQDIAALVSPVDLTAEKKDQVHKDTSTDTTMKVPVLTHSSSSVIELYNRNTRIADIMEHYGYTIKGDKFVRPDKNARDGMSGTIDENRNSAYTFSSNDPGYDAGNTSPSGAGCTLTPFDLLVKLSFYGDPKAAVKHLHQAVMR